MLPLKRQVMSGFVLVLCSSILASTNSGGGGDIQLNLQDSLIMRRGSLLDTESFSIGNGGNMVLKTAISSPMQ